ncbi:hypothetical protein JTB14_031263 [Gonioctena quinquepunctata]|nr:hypothetical protein JTB14_031263 [Gonioctena quinquepunctata]
MMFEVVKLFIVILISAKGTNACNGYTMKVLYVKPCIENSLTQPKNISVIMDPDCNLIYRGCAEVSKTVKMAKGSYEIRKPPMPPMSGDLDLCDVLENGSGFSQFDESLAITGLPKKCPISAGLICGKENSKLSLGPLKNKLALGVGTTTVKLQFDGGVGKSCLEFSFLISKPRKG